ncbi:MAG TPA: hypothetical protein VHE35_23325 [Kofleriaceae bacterium]|nr:hypothetical protein [Kofleriaceae bacterium]
MHGLLAASLIASLAASVAASLAACGGDDGGADSPASFDLDGDLTGAHFFDAPFPSDLRLDPDGTLAYAGLPNVGGNRLIDQLRNLSDGRVGAPTMPVAYFRFDVELPARVPADVIPAEPTSPILLVDIDPASPEKGRLYPVVAQTFGPDDMAVPHLLGVAPRPGFVLAPSTKYAVIIRRAAAPGVAQARAIADLAAGKTPDGARGAAAVGVYAPLWPALAALDIAADDVVTATVFTTGDETALLYRRTEAIRAAHDAVISNIRIDPTDGAMHREPGAGYCELLADVTFPQFQAGTPPFDTDGQFVLDAQGVPIVQRMETVPLTLTIPDGEMPAGGWPLYQFFHGSGGLSSGVVDLGYSPTAADEPIAGEGPAFVVARYGIATASSALPLNPERYHDASDYEYLNLQNLGAFPYTFQQGVIEQRLLLDALLALRIPASTLDGCRSTLPAGVSEHRFSPDRLTAGGQSMGGMYTNMVGAVEPRFGAVVPTGAGGFWNLMILDTALIGGARGFMATVFSTDADQLSFMHPGMELLGAGWEIAEPMVAMSRLARRPLPGAPARSVYEPVGKGDMYFPTQVYDAAALAYGNQQAGTEEWPAMQQALALDDLDGLATYPVSQNRPAADGTRTTRVVVQFEPDGLLDAHYIYRQLETVKHQYGCFLSSYIHTGTAVVPAPAPLAAPCD